VRRSSGFSQPGSGIYNWLNKQFADISPDGVRYKFRSGEGEVLASFVGTISKTQHSDAAKNPITWDNMPPAPDHNPGGLGLTSTDSVCSFGSTGGTNYSARLTVTWTYQNTTDTNNDGVKDSNPGWVMTGITTANLELHTSGEPRSC